MRNLFDQYSQQENRLTHALAVCLDEDRLLLRDFIRWTGVETPKHARDLVIMEQGVPGDLPDTEEEAERRGLPDVVIHDDDKWCLLIESKVNAALTDDQLRRHSRTLVRRGFEQIHRLALTKQGTSLSDGLIHRTWPQLYTWLGQAARRREWPDRLRAYLRAAELRLAREGYLMEGTLTAFDGFRFSNKNPYTYGEAKRLLKLVLEELKQNPRLRAMGMDPTAGGRGAIKGREASVVWDYLSLEERPAGKKFTKYLHLTLGVHHNHLEVAITIPNGVIGSVRRRLANLGVEGMVAMHAEILRRARPLIGREASVVGVAMQRHYRTQSSLPTLDATLEFKLETSLPDASGRVKPEREWVEAFAKATRATQANVQFQYRVNYPWTMPGLDTRKSLDLIVDGWVALEPVLDRLRDRLMRSARE